MIKKRFSAAVIALVFAISIPSFAFANEKTSTGVTAGVGASVTTEANSGVIRDIANNTGNNDSVKQEVITKEENAGIGDADKAIGNQKPAEQNKDTVKEEAGSQPTETSKTENPVPVVEQPTVTEPAVVVEPVTTQPAVVAERPVSTEPAVVADPAVTQPAIVVEPVATEPAIVTDESTLVILHQFETEDVVCQDYETITGLTAGQIIRIGDYNYEDKYEFTECLNGDETAKLVKGENQITLKYTLKEGYTLSKKGEGR